MKLLLLLVLFTSSISYGDFNACVLIASNQSQRLFYSHYGAVPGFTNGCLVVQQDTNVVYEWNGVSYIAVGGPGAGISSLNGLTAGTQVFATGTSGTDFSISSSVATHTFNIPSSSGTNRGLLLSADWTSFTGAASATTAATNANTASTIVKRDASGNFSSGTITASLSGNATNITGVAAIANGGTGQTTASAAFNALSPLTTGGDLLYGGASGAGTRLANGTAGQHLQSNGTTLAPSWVSVNSIIVFSSTATAGGAATEAVTVTGLLSSDTILSVSQKTKGGNSLPLLGWSTQINDGITVIYSADMGSGAIVLVSVKR